MCNRLAGSGELMSVPSSEPELQALMVAGLDGDATAYRDLLVKLSGQLRAYFKGQLVRINRGPVEAEDLVQEVLMAIHTRRHTYDRAQLFTPWMYGIARYKFLDYLRRTKGSTKEAPIEDLPEMGVVDDSAHIESALDLERLLTRIPLNARQAIQCVKLDGLSVAEAAERTGMSESAVKVSVHRGLKFLARVMHKEMTQRED